MKSDNEPCELRNKILIIIICFIGILITTNLLFVKNKTIKNVKKEYKEPNLINNYQLKPRYEKKQLLTTQNIKIEKQPEQTVDCDENKYIDLNYGSQKNIDTAIKIRNDYGEIIEKYSKIYGLDAELMKALAVQERGNEGHSEEIDEGGAVGIMQIQYSAWIGEVIKVYNYEINDYEIITVDDSVRELEQNIKIACMIFQFELTKQNYNIIAGLQSYNYGGNSVYKVIDYYASLNNTSYDAIISSNDIGWLDYRDNIISIGDSNYVENVLRWYNGDGSINFEKTDKTYININLNKQNNC